MKVRNNEKLKKYKANVNKYIWSVYKCVNWVTYQPSHAQCVWMYQFKATQGVCSPNRLSDHSRPWDDIVRVRVEEKAIFLEWQISGGVQTQSKAPVGKTP